MDKETIFAIVSAIKELGIAGQQAFLLYLVFKFIPILIMCFFAFYCTDRIVNAVKHYYSIANHLEEIARRTGKLMKRDGLHFDFYGMGSNDVVDEIVSAIKKNKNFK